MISTPRNKNHHLAGLNSDAAKSRRYRLGEFGWIWIATALLFLASALIAPGTMRSGALYAMLPFAAILAIVAMGQTLVIQQRGLDMSVVAVVALGGILAAQVSAWSGSVLIGVLASLAAAALLGTINGFLIAKFSIVPLVATLATNALFLGIVRIVSNNMVVPAPVALTSFVSGAVLGIPNVVLLSMAAILAVTVVTHRTTLGRGFVFVGSAPRTARAAGLNVTGYQISAYAIASTCFALAGILLSGLISSASHLAGPEYLLPGIAAVVVGGTAFTGGRGSVIASGVAAVFMEQLSQLVLSFGAGTAGQLLVQASAIVIATSLRGLPALAAALCAHRPHSRTRRP